MKKEKLSLDINGRSIYGILEAPDTDVPKMPLVIMMHCFMGSTRENGFFELCKMFHKHGAATLRFDFVGHGRSDGTLLDMNFTSLGEDTEAVINYVKSLSYISDVYLLGHSLGGLMSTFLAQKYPDYIKGMMLLAPACNARWAAENGILFGIRFDPNNVPEYIEDPAIGLRMSRQYIEEGFNIDVFDGPGIFKSPVLATSGENDTRVPADFVRKYQNTYSNFEFHLIPEIDHLFHPDVTELVQCVENFFVSIL